MIATTSIKVAEKEHNKATSVKEHNATSSKSIAKEHDATTIETAATINELEEATLHIHGENLKLSSFIPAGFTMRKSPSRPTMVVTLYTCPKLDLALNELCVLPLLYGFNESVEILKYILSFILSRAFLCLAAMSSVFRGLSISPYHSFLC